MSQDRNMKWLNDRRIIYRDDGEDIPTIETKEYKYHENGTYYCYHLFNSKAKITTYKSLKWYFLVLYYLNQDSQYSLSPFFEHLARFIANKDNGFVTFFISEKALNDMIIDVYQTGGDAPKNKLRKVIFKYGNGLCKEEKLRIVGELIGRSKRIHQDDIYNCMLDLNDMNKKITISNMAKLLECSTRTVHRNMNTILKREKELLNQQL